jgi:hypothetical protein
LRYLKSFLKSLRKRCNKNQKNSLKKLKRETLKIQERERKKVMEVRIEILQKKVEIVPQRVKQKTEKTAQILKRFKLNQSHSFESFDLTQSKNSSMSLRDTQKNFLRGKPIICGNYVVIKTTLIPL